MRSEKRTRTDTDCFLRRIFGRNYENTQFRYFNEIGIKIMLIVDTQKVWDKWFLLDPGRLVKV